LLLLLFLLLRLFLLLPLFLPFFLSFPSGESASINLTATVALRTDANLVHMQTHMHEKTACTNRRNSRQNQLVSALNSAGIPA
jgi:ABC-type spermidine/putrescine transport system permease subunit II